MRDGGVRRGARSVIWGGRAWGRETACVRPVARPTCHWRDGGALRYRSLRAQGAALAHEWSPVRAHVLPDRGSTLDRPIHSDTNYTLIKDPCFINCSYIFFQSKSINDAWLTIDYLRLHYSYNVDVIDCVNSIIFIYYFIGYFDTTLLKTA